MTLIQYARIFPERNAEVPGGTFGTRPGTPSFTDARLLSEGIEGGPDLTAEADAQNALGPSGMENSGKTYGGSITQKVRVDDGIDLLFLCLFGKVVTTQVDAGPPAVHDHVYTPLDDFADTAPSMGMDLGIEKAREYRYSGVLVNSVTINKTNAGELNLSWDVIAKNRVTAAFDTGHTPTWSTKTKLQSINTATLHGQAVTWDSLTITLRRNWDQTKNFSGNTLPHAEIGPFDIEISGSLKFENANPNFVDTFEAGTEGELTLLARGDVIQTTFFEELKIEFDRLRIDNVTPAHIAGTSRKIESIRMTGLVPTTGDWAKLTLRNALATPATYP